jgi:hypothetical protein
MADKANMVIISITLPEKLAKEIMKVCSQKEFNKFFIKAFEYYLAYRMQTTALEKGFGAWKNKNHPDLSAPEDSSAYVRSIRYSAE